MSRSARLLDLIQALRGRRRPVTAAAMAEALGVTPRTIYRDIATLVAQGAPIEGEAGVGYVLRPGFLLPPLMFGEDEVEALVLGLGLVLERGDDALSEAAATARARILAVLPSDLRDRAERVGLMAAPAGTTTVRIDLAAVRNAIRREHRLVIDYADSASSHTTRAIWPLTLAFFPREVLLVAWCELRTDFRSFRADRIERLEETGQRYPRRRDALLAEWRRREGLPDPA